MDNITGKSGVWRIRVPNKQGRRIERVQPIGKMKRVKNEQDESSRMVGGLTAALPGGE